MKFKLVIVLMLIALPVAAQQQPTEYTLKVTAQELDLIAKALGTQPFNDVAPFMQKLRLQIIEQQQNAMKKIEPDNK